MNAIDVLGLKMKVENWDYNNQLPLYIQNTYTVKKVWINDMEVIMLQPNTELPNISALRNHMTKIQSTAKLPEFFKLEILSDYRKNNLLSHNIFIIILISNM